MRVDIIKSKTDSVAFGTRRELQASQFRSEWSPDCDSSHFGHNLKSPRLSPLQRELLMLPDSVVDWANKNRRTPDGTYLIFVPNAHYDKKKDKYVDIYSLVNEYQKNVYKHNRHKYHKDSYYTQNIPEGYEIKKVFGFATIVSEEDEQLLRKKSALKVVCNSFAAVAATALAGFGVYQMIDYAKHIK